MKALNSFIHIFDKYLPDSFINFLTVHLLFEQRSFLSFQLFKLVWGDLMAFFLLFLVHEVEDILVEVFFHFKGQDLDDNIPNVFIGLFNSDNFTDLKRD